MSFASNALCFDSHVHQAFGRCMGRFHNEWIHTGQEKRLVLGWASTKITKYRNQKVSFYTISTLRPVRSITSFFLSSSYTAVTSRHGHVECPSIHGLEGRTTSAKWYSVSWLSTKIIDRYTQRNEPLNHRLHSTCIPQICMFWVLELILRNNP